MKYSAAALMLVCLANSTGLADDDLWKQFSQLVAGEWTCEGIVEGIESSSTKAGDRFTIRSSFELVLGGKAIVGQQEFKLLDKDHVAQSRYLAGWDPKNKTVDIIAYWSDGDTDRVSLSRKEGNTLAAKYEFTADTGKAVKLESEFKIIDQNTFVWNSDGKHPVTWKRVK